MVEELQMCREDFYVRLDLLDKRIKKTNSIVSKCKESNDILLDKIDSYKEQLIRVEKHTVELDADLEETKFKKLDKIIYEK